MKRLTEWKSSSLYHTEGLDYQENRTTEPPIIAEDPDNDPVQSLPSWAGWSLKRQPLTVHKGTTSYKANK